MEYCREEKGKSSYKVTMLCWSLNDEYVVTAGSDHVLRVWSSDKGEELRELKGHKDDAYVLLSHNVFDEYVISAGHDGLLIVS